MTNLWRLVLAITVLVFWQASLRSAETKSRETPAQTTAQLAKVVDKLAELAIKFDADKDQTLTSAEQEELLKFVGGKFGEAWAKRTRRFLGAADTNHDGRIELAEWQRAIRGLDRSPDSSLVKETLMVAMSDGVHLATDVYRPKGDGSLPVIFIRTPYHRTNSEEFAKGQVPHGYVVVAQDMRGRFESEGENIPFIGCGWADHHDGVDTLAWIHKQPWANDKVCTIGGSAGGITQNLLAGAAPQGLTAQHISVAAASLYHHATYVGGALRKCQVENWNATNRFDPQALKLVKDHPAYDDHWRKQDTTLRFAEMNTPAVHVGGWFDTFAQGTIDSFVGRQYHGGEGARGKQKLVMGPWTHAVGRMEDYAELIFPNCQFPKAYESGRWFEYHLAGVDNGVMREPAVAYYVLGDTRDSQAPGNEWRTADAWPIPHRATSYYFHTDGALGLKQPASTGGVEYTFDPANPCPTIGGNNLSIPRGPMNQNPLESRDDVVTFTTEPLTEPLEVTGRVTAKVFVASSAVDSDLSIRLCDVYPDGKSYNLAEGMLRLRYRNSFEKPEPLTPGEAVEVSVDCWSTSIVFNRGHRLRVTVTSSNYPRFDLNPGTGKPWVDGEPSVKQTNRILCSASQASRIILPVIETPAK